MKTYPTFPQPIINQAGGLNWYLELSNAGVLRVGGTTTDAPTPLSRLKLVDPTGRAAYRLGLDSGSPPTVTATALLQASDASYQDLPVWSINGREWNLRVTSAGALVVSAIATDWRMADQPTLLDPAGRMWDLQILDSGVTQTDGPRLAPIVQGQPSVKLRSDDDTVSYAVTIDNEGILFVDGPNDVREAEFYEVLLTSANGLRFALSVDASGILGIDDGFQAIEALDQYPIIWQRRSNVLYVVDTRFRPPVPGMTGRTFGRRAR
jgi:hypothetical protein